MGAVAVVYSFGLSRLFNHTVWHFLRDFCLEHYQLVIVYVSSPPPTQLHRHLRVHRRRHRATEHLHLSVRQPDVALPGGALGPHHHRALAHRLLHQLRRRLAPLLPPPLDRHRPRQGAAALRVSLGSGYHAADDCSRGRASSGSRRSTTSRRWRSTTRTGRSTRWRRWRSCDSDSST